ncbi:MAG: ABC transporter permease [Candidatus Bathyarchaeota archaeon]|nr:MAG: ABC transporter permease [Candidatus Bathyarchaeota archaeon]
MRKLLFVVERDLRTFLQFKVLIIMRGIWFAAQVAFFGLIASRMVVPELADIYFEYYIAGVVVMTLYSSSVFIGYDLFEEAEHGVFEYLLSLPISRKELVVGRSIGGGVRSFIFVGPIIAIALYVIGLANPVNLLIALSALFLFAFGVSGMSITIAVSLKSGDRFDILMGVVNALIVRLSTTMYPQSFVQRASGTYAIISQFNPVTFASDLFRWGAGIERYLTMNPMPLAAIVGLVIFFFTFTLIGVTIYERRLEGGGWQ